MSEKLEGLQKLANKKGWNILKIQNGKYKIYTTIDGKIDIEEYRFNLKDVRLFLQGVHTNKVN